MNYLTYSKLKITHFFDKFILQRKSVQQAQPLNIVQSVQNFAHKLIFLCVTRAALWSHTFPTFSFLCHTSVYCYVYSLPPCYFTQSALPIYQTGGCSMYYTCDLSRVMDFARCRLFAQLGHTLELVSDDR